MSRNSGAEIRPSDEDLVRGALSGASENFASLYVRYYPRTYRLAYGMTKNKSAAEDLTQEIFIRTYQKLEKFNFKSTFATWFYRLALNHCINQRRHRPTYDHLMQDENALTSDATQSSAEESIFKAQLQDQIHSALLTLKPKLRLIVILKDIEGLSYEEVAERLEIPLGTVASRLNRARKLLAHRLAHLKGMA